MSTPRVTARETRSESRMATGCDSRPRRFNGNLPASAALRLADLWDCSARQARDRIARCFTDAADVIVALMSTGQHDRLAKLMAPMEAANMAWSGAPPMADAVAAAGDADGQEDSAEARYHAHPSRETARVFVRALAVQNLHSERLQAALIHQWEL